MLAAAVARVLGTGWRWIIMRDRLIKRMQNLGGQGARRTADAPSRLIAPRLAPPGECQRAPNWQGSVGSASGAHVRQQLPLRDQSHTCHNWIRSSIRPTTVTRTMGDEPAP